MKNANNSNKTKYGRFTLLKDINNVITFILFHLFPFFCLSLYVSFSSSIFQSHTLFFPLSVYNLSPLHVSLIQLQRPLIHIPSKPFRLVFISAFTLNNFSIFAFVRHRYTHILVNVILSQFFCQSLLVDIFYIIFYAVMQHPIELPVCQQRHQILQLLCKRQLFIEFLSLVRTSFP